MCGKRGGVRRSRGSGGGRWRAGVACGWGWGDRGGGGECRVSTITDLEILSGRSLGVPVMLSLSPLALVSALVDLFSSRRRLLLADCGHLVPLPPLGRLQRSGVSRGRVVLFCSLWLV